MVYFGDEGSIDVNEFHTIGGYEDNTVSNNVEDICNTQINSRRPRTSLDYAVNYQPQIRREIIQLYLFILESNVT